MNKYQQFGLVQRSGEYRGRSTLVVQLWWIVQGTLFALSPQFMYGWRNFLLRLFGARIGRNVLIRPSARFTYPWKISLGDFCRIGDDAVLYSLGNINIGNHSVISQRSYLCTGSHDFEKVTFDLIYKPINISDQVWIGADVFIAPGVRIDTGVVVGARSTVFHDLPEGMVCYGSPAVPIRVRKT